MAALAAHTRTVVAARPSLLLRRAPNTRPLSAWWQRPSGTARSTGVAARSSRPDGNTSVVLEETADGGLRIRITAAESNSNASSSSQAAGGGLRIEVPTQTQLAELLKDVVSALDLCAVSQPQLVQLMLLADRWELSDLQSAAATALEATPAAEWEWETLMAVLSLPPGCRDSRAFSRAITAATAKLQQQLGDLELVHNDASGIKQLQLLTLPFVALKQLLQDPTTRVHSENTVLYSIQEWHEHQQQQQQDSEAGEAQLQQQAAELLRLVRMRHCSQLYVATVFGPSALAASCFTPAELQLAVAISVPAGGSSSTWQSAWQAAKEANSPVLAKHPAWSADERPASALKQSFDWRLPLSELQPLLERHLADPGRNTEVFYCPTTLTWQGHELLLKLHCSSSTEAQPRTTCLGVYLCVRNLPDGAVCRVRENLEVVPAGAAKSKVLGPSLRGYGATNGWGWQNAIRLGTVTTWEEAAAVLRQKGLVHAGTGGAGKSLLLRLTVIEIQ